MVKMGKLKKRKMRKFSVKEQNIIKHIYEDYKNSQNGYILGNVFWYELNKNKKNMQVIFRNKKANCIIS